MLRPLARKRPLSIVRGRYGHVFFNTFTKVSANLVSEQGTGTTAGRPLQPIFLDGRFNGPQTTPTDPFTGSHAAAVVSMTEKRDVMQLWSLLEACLQTNNKVRALSILKSLYEIKSHRAAFIDDYNFYFNAVCADARSLGELERMLEEQLNAQFTDVTYNDKTLAIMVHHAIRLGDTVPNLKIHLETYFRMSEHGVKSVCSYADVLTISDYSALLNKYRTIRDRDIPGTIRKLVTSQQMSTGETLLPQVTDVPEKDVLDKPATLDKDATVLKDVDTVGMKVVKHTLLGLSLTKEQQSKIANLSFEDTKNIMNFDEAKSIDFFQIYQSLQNDVERTQFESAINEFNQDRQRALELRATDAAKERWKHDFEDAKQRGDLAIQKSLNAKLWKWYSGMLPILKKEIELCRQMQATAAKGHSTRAEYAPYLTLVTPEKMCVITILEILKLNSTGGITEGMRTARAVISVGQAVEMEFRSEQLLKNESRMFKEVNKKSNTFKKIVRSAKSAFRAMEIEKQKLLWPQAIRAKVGSILVSMLIRIADVTVEGTDPITKEKVYGKTPAFSHSYQYHNGVKLGIVKIHKSLINQLNGERLVASVQPQLLPMLVKPREWKNWKSGGYFYSQSTLVRSRDCPEQLAYLEAASNSNAIDKVYDGLNVLGNTAWTVNRNIFNVVSKVWNEGKPFLEIPGTQEILELLPPPPKGSDPAVINEWRTKNRYLSNEYSANRSMRCDLNYKLEIARAFLGEKFYFPHNVDFRGRAYPLSPHFNHLGNDMSRGLLIFWKGKKLGSLGLKWLKVHLSNLYGVDKVSLDDRVAFIESQLDEVKDSAEDPLNGRGWWKKADKPWQALATCMELNEALKLDNPEDFVSHQPVHQDGTCNGLQHYAALGGDMEGAEQVNLIPGAMPKDVYSHVANIVRSRLQVLVEQENDPMAKFLVDKLNRKVVKQTVMTHVYGVTLVGATLQIDKQIGDYFSDHRESLKYSKYLAKHVFAAIRESFKGAHLIQDWLGECCKRISKSVRLDVDEKSFKNGDKLDFMTSIIWTTPLGLPIVQPYREVSKKQVDTNLQTVFISDPFAVNQINARRQKAGFPPNFIHSLDASHMLLSASKCAEEGLDFASVHDSYWTHACDVEKMNKHIRNEFVTLHEVDLIERLKEEFDERYRNYVQILKILKHSPLGKQILQLRADLTKKLGRPATLADEIYVEKKRQMLLQSESQEEQAAGRQMVTTISVAETCPDLDLEEGTPIPEKTSILILVPLKLPSIPPKDNFDVHEVKNSTYFFS
ncbi:DNA-directed RNA polymerase KNAG_0E03120 [Huiozyma naganishii CBS 8797]|uniref:DNA-directed RNA polymerase n=1 Tax=Huiozyma naganishii (strain ATCC MYA-139 / BCRC 22969 / CBS 8797 / KCTC 17520 / NBRC 10181 / NCYC 3082 / Yp74L-3) TaxID=1071383 RepID=J7S7Y3_HUIN7|nr:hypothetical protein KNAG_0E03120 [Kazachstania naganishii CBS 8797]CCK70571.1 hypothetical protein KNAG_0E03120 [Kazachstania naganishii CBS 8797]